MNFPLCACIEPLYCELPFLERSAAARRDGFDFVEFWSWADKDLAAVGSAAQAAGIGIAGFNGDGPFSLIDPAEQADYLSFLRRSAKAARLVGKLQRTADEFKRQLMSMDSEIEKEAKESFEETVGKD